MPGCAGWQDTSSGSATRGCSQWDLLRPGLTGAWLLLRFWGRCLRGWDRAEGAKIHLGLPSQRMLAQITSCWKLDMLVWARESR